MCDEGDFNTVMVVHIPDIEEYKKKFDYRKYSVYTISRGTFTNFQVFGDSNDRSFFVELSTIESGNLEVYILTYTLEENNKLQFTLMPYLSMFDGSLY